jgi:hypothetical protein
MHTLAVKAGVESKLEAKIGKGYIRDKIVKQIGTSHVHVSTVCRYSFHQEKQQ